MDMKKDETKGQEAQDQAQPADISGYIAALESSFEPASELKEVTHWFSTDEVVDAIRDIDPSAKVSKEQVYQALRDAGYEYGVKPGTQGLLFRWMLHARE